MNTLTAEPATPSHEGVRDATHAWLASDRAPAPLALVEQWDAAVRGACHRMDALRTEGDALEADVDEAAARAIAVLQDYAAVLGELHRALSRADGDAAGRILPRLGARHEAVRAAHAALAALSSREAPGLDLDPRFAAPPHLLRLHAALQAYLRGGTRASEAAAVLADLTVCFYRAASQMPGEPPEDGADEAIARVRAASRQLSAAYILGLDALEALERRLPLRRVEALRESWSCLQAAYDQIVRAQAVLADLEEEMGLDVGEEDL